MGTSTRDRNIFVACSSLAKPNWNMPPEKFIARRCFHKNARPHAEQLYRYITATFNQKTFDQVLISVDHFPIDTAFVNLLLNKKAKLFYKKLGRKQFTQSSVYSFRSGEQIQWHQSFDCFLTAHQRVLNRARPLATEKDLVTIWLSCQSNPAKSSRKWYATSRLLNRKHPS